MHKNRRIAGWAGAAAVLLLLAWLLGRHSAAGISLRQYRAGLLAKGERLTFSALTGASVAGTNDTQSILTNAVSAISSTKLDPSMLTPREYVSAGRARVLWRLDTPVAGGGYGQGRAPQGTWNEFAAEVDQARLPLAALRQALKSPESDAGPLTSANFVTHRINFVAVRRAAQWLMGASLCELHQGHLEESLADLEALAGLAQMDHDEYTLVAQMIRVAVTGLGTATTWELLQAPGWTEPQLLRMQRAWEKVDLLDGVERAALGERAIGEEVWAQLRSPDHGRRWNKVVLAASGKRSLEDILGDWVLLPAYRMTCMDRDELFHLQTTQQALEAVRALQRHQPWAQSRASLDKIIGRINRIANSPQRYRYLYSLVMIPNFLRAAEAATKREGERQLTITAIALKRYELREHHLPENLSELVPNYLPQLSYDPMSGNALCYHLKPDGTFLLYSVGEDGHDDRGDPRVTSGHKPGLWEGRDAVWPAPAVSLSAR
jgi:hypothetical protein